MSTEDGVFYVTDPEPGTVMIAGFDDVCEHGDEIQEGDTVRRTDTGWTHVTCPNQDREPYEGDGFDPYQEDVKGA